MVTFSDTSKLFRKCWILSVSLLFSGLGRINDIFGDLGYFSSPFEAGYMSSLLTAGQCTAFTDEQ